MSSDGPSNQHVGITPEQMQARIRERAGIDEPEKRGARVKDRDGHIWRKGTTRWTCEAPIGTRYFDTRKNRMAVVESVGRLPWSNLASEYGPLTLVE